MASADTSDPAEPFPSLSRPNTVADPCVPNQPDVPAAGDHHDGRRRASSASSVGRMSRTRSSSLLQSFMNSNLPLGMWQATGEVGSKIPTLNEIRSGAFADEGWSHEGQMERRGTNPHEIHRRRIARTSSASTRTRASTMTPTPGAIPEERIEYFPAHETLIEESSKEGAIQAGEQKVSTSESTMKPSEVITTAESVALSSSSSGEKAVVGPDETGTYPNGYRFPKKHTWTQSTMIGLKAFWKFFITPFGFVITIYGLNVVAWGAMIFFVLLNAAPAMCHPSCDDINSARKKWIEYDSQILNGLFCVTGFGLIPWRFRDFYFLMRWRLFKDTNYFRRLAGINRGWFRLPGSDMLAETVGPPPVYDKKHPQTEESPPPFTDEEIEALEANPAIPLPATSMPDAPLTGIRAKPTKPWKIDVVVWMYLLNTGFQACLAGFMWGLTRFTRPSWATGFFISIGCVVAIVAGIVVFIEGSKVKKVEGIPVHEYDVFETLEEMQARKEKEKRSKKHRKDEEKKGAEEGEGDEEMGDLTLTRTRTEKTKGRDWYER